MANRASLEAEWLTLTRQTLPGMAAARGWPVREDHCFQRILLDNAAGGRWYDAISGRPAYRYAPAELLERAIALGREAIEGTKHLAAMNRRSLEWRGKAAELSAPTGTATAGRRPR